MAKLRVLHVLGIDDTDMVKVTVLGATIARSQITYIGNVELKLLMSADELDISLLVRGGMPIDSVQLPPVDIVLNAICDCDTNGNALRSASEVVRQVGKPVVNDPELVLRTARDVMPTILGDIEGVHFPRTARIQPTSKAHLTDMVASRTITPPFLLREAGAHGGLQLVLVRDTSREELLQLDQFALDGRDFYATEFVDFASPDGRYRKYRVIVIGGRPFPRHLIISDAWNIHAESRQTLMTGSPELRAEEEAHIRGFDPDAWPVFRRLHERLGLDYFGVDFSLREDGTLIVFEINCCCRPVSGTQHLGDHHEALARNMADAFTGMLFDRAGVARHAAV